MGVLCRYGAHIINEADPDMNFDTIVEVYRHYLASHTFDVKQRALQVSFRYEAGLRRK
jgi:hypothetical protein